MSGGLILWVLMPKNTLGLIFAGIRLWGREEWENVANA
jgi:hypothetical protein